MERRLAAILLTDMVGYSRLMALDEEGTIARQKAHREEIIEPKVSAHGGRIVKSTGDGLLVEFASVVDAVKCAVGVQEALACRDTDVPEERRIQYRIGINLGDIVLDGDDILGDGVNVAARLEGLAQPGGICISGTVHDHLAGKVNAVFEDAGEHTVKNVPRPVRVWYWKRDSLADNSPTAVQPPPLPQNPSIAVLPFINSSADPEQEFFADGMAEDLITALSRFRSLAVVPRNSTFSYKGQVPNVQRIGQELGVRYVVEGSVRRSGNRIRISAQLVDSSAGELLWTDRFDRDVTDIFAVQDEATDAIVTAIAPEIDKSERSRAQRKAPENIDAWTLYQQGLIAYHASTEDGIEKAIELFDKATKAEPDFASALALAADARIRKMYHYFGVQDQLLDEAAEKARAALALDDRDHNCLLVSARVHSLIGLHETAIAHARDAVSLNPSSPMCHYALGFVLGRAGNNDEALTHFESAVRLGPRDIFLPGYLQAGALIYFEIERYEEALEWARRASVSSNPRPTTLHIAIAALMKLGRREEASGTLSNLLSNAGRYKTLGSFSEALHRVWPAATQRNKELVDALREAGLPE